jgi:hypothetical protein
MTNVTLLLNIFRRISLHFTLRLGSVMQFLETSSLQVSLTGGEEQKQDRHAIMIIIIINIKQRQKRSGERETMITIKMTAGKEGGNK